MSALKLILGFLVGLLACAILLALISIRMPITIENAEGARVIQTERVARAILEETNIKEQNENKNTEEEVVQTESQFDAISIYAERIRIGSCAE